MFIKVASHTINTDHIKYILQSGPTQITIHFIDGTTVIFAGDDATTFVKMFESILSSRRSG
jgi:hypothetical protein